MSVGLAKACVQRKEICYVKEKSGALLTMEVCLTAHLSLLKIDPCSWVTHEFVEMFVVFLVILSMNNYIICNAYHSIAVGEDLVHHPLEDVLCAG